MIDPTYVENQFIDGFQESYHSWLVEKNLRSLLYKTTLRHLRLVPEFLNLNLNYNDLVESLTSHNDFAWELDNGNVAATGIPLTISKGRRLNSHNKAEKTIFASISPF
mmetsp:Transcript_8006/g.8698  ORF Transcript_8006/g.8698 Transcript_8006/m.8698 type:complete len:108 (+) Transcript_8006:3-326(+)